MKHSSFLIFFVCFVRNVFFQRITALKRKDYLHARRGKQFEIASFVVSIVENLKPKGNFLKKSKDGTWVKVTADA
jgi:hypothetical protein